MGGYILIYGVISGLAVICTMIMGLEYSDFVGVLASRAVGYLIMLVALSLIFVAIKRYRDRELGGVIRFGRAFGLGLAIAAVAGVAYVFVWEIYLAVTDYRFMDQYVEGILSGAQADGMASVEYAALQESMDTMRERYANPLIRLPMTFTEIFPVGAIVALISAALLRNSRVLPA